ncbi:MAG: hypothetical protein HW380_3696 [Magnetococcales bacterium]|nr:hypothetical protein [Magnetococcales bacterium]
MEIHLTFREFFKRRNEFIPWEEFAATEHYATGKTEKGDMVIIQMGCEKRSEQRRKTHGKCVICTEKRCAVLYEKMEEKSRIYLDEKKKKKANQQNRQKNDEKKKPFITNQRTFAGYKSAKEIQKWNPASHISESQRPNKNDPVSDWRRKWRQFQNLLNRIDFVTLAHLLTRKAVLKMTEENFGRPLTYAEKKRLNLLSQDLTGFREMLVLFLNYLNLK